MEVELPGCRIKKHQDSTQLKKQKEKHSLQNEESPLSAQLC